MQIEPTDAVLCASDEPGGEVGSVPVTLPIVQTSLFAFPTFEALVEAFSGESREPVYTRGRNPTVMAVEGKLAALERGEACACFGSGMAAISAVMMALLQSGDHVLFVNQVYGPTLQLARHLGRFGIRHDVLLDVDVDAVRDALTADTRLVWLESPGTMLFRMLDVEAVATLAREHGALTCLDNSWATPLLQKPLELGVDVVVHSASKYLGGHSDLVAGVVVTSHERMEVIFRHALMLNGGILGPFEAWLLHRGLRTLPVRLARHEGDALSVATFLTEHPAVRGVHHPAFGDRTLADRQLRGYSGLFSFELARSDFATVARFVNALRRFRIGVSWGGPESLVISPDRPRPGTLTRLQGLPPGLVRLSIGLEGADVLVEDLDAALGVVS